MGRGDMPTPSVVCIRFPPADLATVERAAAIMGEGVTAFTRTAGVTLAKAILEASAKADIRRSSWSSCRLDGSLEQKRTPKGETP